MRGGRAGRARGCRPPAGTPRLPPPSRGLSQALRRGDSPGGVPFPPEGGYFPSRRGSPQPRGWGVRSGAGFTCCLCGGGREGARRGSTRPQAPHGGGGPAGGRGTAFGDGSLRGTMRGKDPIPGLWQPPLGSVPGLWGGPCPSQLLPPGRSFPFSFLFRLFEADPELPHVPHNYLNTSRCTPFTPSNEQSRTPLSLRCKEAGNILPKQDLGLRGLSGCVKACGGRVLRYVKLICSRCQSG